MSFMKSMASKLALLLLVSASVARADAVFSVTDEFLTVADPLQQGRLVRGGLAQDWTGVEAFPGTNNPSGLFHYRTYEIDIGEANFVQVLVDSLSPFTFVSAYLGSYNPAAGLQTNWLGDTGFSGNFIFDAGDTGDTNFFQVVVPDNSKLVIVVNETNVGLGTGDNNPYSLLVEAFCDTEYTDAVRGRCLNDQTVPEPAPLALLLVPGALMLRTRLRAAKRAQG